MNHATVKTCAYLYVEKLNYYQLMFLTIFTEMFSIYSPQGRHKNVYHDQNVYK